MSTVIRTRVIKIGNSQGIRIPKLLLEELHLDKDVEREVQDEQLVIWRAQQRRCGWDEQFRLMAAQGGDSQAEAMPATLTRWDQEAWEW